MIFGLLGLRAFMPLLKYVLISVVVAGLLAVGGYDPLGAAPLIDRLIEFI